jgi:hypothetical protein
MGSEKGYICGNQARCIGAGRIKSIPEEGEDEEKTLGIIEYNEEDYKITERCAINIALHREIEEEKPLKYKP